MSTVVSRAIVVSESYARARSDLCGIALNALSVWNYFWLDMAGTNPGREQLWNAVNVSP